MQNIWKVTFSSFVTMLLIVTISVVLTGNLRNEEYTKYGKTVVTSEGANIYVSSAGLSFILPSSAERYFKDTKNNWVAQYIDRIGAEYVSELKNDSYGLEVYVNPDYLCEYFENTNLNNVNQNNLNSDSTNQNDANQNNSNQTLLNLNNWTSDQISDLDGYLCEKMEVSEEVFLTDGIVMLGDIPFYHSYFMVQIPGEYDLISDYIAVIDGNFVELRFYKYANSAFSVNDESVSVDEKFASVLSSITYGDATPEVKISSSGGWAEITKYSFSLWILLVPLFFIWFGNAKRITNYGEWHENAFGREHSKEILGIFAVFIVLHHLVQKIGAENAGILSILEYFGVCFVGLYFFYSGYGLFVSFKKKKDYLKNFLGKRLPPVLIPFYVCILIFVICDVVQNGFHKETIWAMTGWLLINDHMWYIVEIVILYLAFWIIFRFCKKEKTAFITMGIFITFMVTGSLLSNHGDRWFQGEWWYNSTFLFLIGMLFAKYEIKIIIWIRRYYSKIIVVTSVIYIALFVSTTKVMERYGYWSELSGKAMSAAYGDKAITLLVQLPMIISFVFLILVAGQKLQCSNKVLRFFGKISLELYLIHNLFLRSFDFISGAGMYCVVVLLVSILAAYSIHKLDEYLCNLVLKRNVSVVKKQSESLEEQKQSELTQDDTILERNSSSKVALEKNKENKNKTNQSEQILQIENIKNSIRSNLHYLRYHPDRVFRKLFREIICFAFAALSLYPLIYMAINATQDGRILSPAILPDKKFLENLEMVNLEFASAGGSIYQGIINSCIIATLSALVATYLGAMTAYAFERYRFKGRNLLWGFIIACMLMPSVAGFVGLYRMVIKVHMLNNFLPVILMGTANPAAVYFIRMYLKNINIAEIGEAARIDGASEMRIFNQIILPLLRPVLALQMTFSFVATWNNGFAQTLLLLEWEKKPVSAYMQLAAGDRSGSMSPETYALMLACTIAPIIVYILCSKSIVSSITLGGLKE